MTRPQTIVRRALHRCAICFLVATGVALSALSGCGDARDTANVLANAVEDVDRTSSPIESTTTAGGSTTTTPAADAT